MTHDNNCLIHVINLISSICIEKKQCKIYSIVDGTWDFVTGDAHHDSADSTRSTEYITEPRTFTPTNYSVITSRQLRQNKFTAVVSLQNTGVGVSRYK